VCEASTGRVRRVRPSSPRHASTITASPLKFVVKSPEGEGTGPSGSTPWTGARTDRRQAPDARRPQRPRDLRKEIDGV
jgi:hypothetical protein